jgi:hypothetical protein
VVLVVSPLLVKVVNCPLTNVVPVLVVEKVVLLSDDTPVKVRVAVVLERVVTVLGFPLLSVVKDNNVVWPVDVDVRRPVKPVLKRRPDGYVVDPPLKPLKYDVVRKVCVGPPLGNVEVVRKTELSRPPLFWPKAVLTAWKV